MAPAPWHRPSSGPAGLAASVLAATGLAALVSGALIFGLPGGAGSIDRTLPGTGSLGELVSAIVPFVWLGLFAALGAAFWLVERGSARLTAAGGAVLGLIAVCSLYPLVASGLSDPAIAIAGNLIVLLAALGTALVCSVASGLAAGLVALVAAWVTVATMALAALALGIPF